MNGRITKQLKTIAASLPAVYITKKVNRVVYGKELLKTKEVYNGELIERNRKYDIVTTASVPVNHLERLK